MKHLKPNYSTGNKGFVDTPQFPGLQNGATIEQVRDYISKSPKTKGYNFAVPSGTSDFNLQLQGNARIWLGFSLLPVKKAEEITNIADMPEEFNLTINNLIICDQTHPSFFTQLLQDREYYKIPTPLSGTDIITVQFQNSGDPQNWIMVAYYI